MGIVSTLGLAASLNRGDLKSQGVGTSPFLPQEEEREMKDGENPHPSCMF